MLAACQCVCVCLFVCARSVYVNINPAGTMFKCQTFNLLNLTLGGIQACHHVTRYRRKKQKDPKIIYQRSISLSAVEQIEMSCGERRESVPIQVVNRRWRLRGGWGGEREVKRERGGLLLPLYNEWGEMPHIWCGTLFILFSCMLEPLNPAHLYIHTSPTTLEIFL